MGIAWNDTFCIDCGARGAGLTTKVDDEGTRGPLCWDCGMKPLDTEKERGRFRARAALHALLAIPLPIRLTQRADTGGSADA